MRPDRHLVRLALLAVAAIALLTGAPTEAAAQAERDPVTGADRGAAGAGGEPAAGEHGGHHADPSKSFNWFSISYRGKDTAGGPLNDGKLGDRPLAPGESESPMSAPFVLMLLNFGILLVLLAKLGGPPARKMAETRSDQIKGALDEAAKLRQAAADKLDEYQAKLSAAEAEMATMLDNMRSDAEAEKQRILTAAEAQAAAVKRDAELRIAAEIQRARVELAREVALAATAAAEKLIRAQATSTDQTRLVEGFLADVERVATGAEETV